MLRRHYGDHECHKQSGPEDDTCAGGDKGGFGNTHDVVLFEMAAVIGSRLLALPRDTGSAAVIGPWAGWCRAIESCAGKLLSRAWNAPRFAVAVGAAIN